ncbi:hypothetical protein OH540_09190 [Streptomyces sp. BPPL-273]|uniref:hypothetical protein n=1 Tax=Streptomyces sp. BPPL-273 TaxID=2987533 RepID=UPI0024AEDAFD|nr:hypothetical protein [Streptomyces sp. BPPL-273]WHM30195.1 hypothetical protein OH540_09190 [Streptomyces sp. BPPL-273]
MNKYVVIHHSAAIQRVEADSVTYDEEAAMWIFRDESKKPIAWVPNSSDILIVALSSAVDNP